MKYVLVALAILLAASACSKYEVYEENLQFMTNETYSAEKAVVAERLKNAEAALAKAEASGNPEAVKKARADYDEAKAKSRAVESEEQRRSRRW